MLKTNCIIKSKTKHVFMFQFFATLTDVKPISPWSHNNRSFTALRRIQLTPGACWVGCALERDNNYCRYYFLYSGQCSNIPMLCCWVQSSTRVAKKSLDLGFVLHWLSLACKSARKYAFILMWRGLTAIKGFGLCLNMYACRPPLITRITPFQSPVIWVPFTYIGIVLCIFKIKCLH